MSVGEHLINQTKDAANSTAGYITNGCTWCWLKIPAGILAAMFGSAQTLIHVLMALVIIDIISGMSVAMKNKQISSYGFSRAIWKFVAYIFVIFAVRLIEMGALGNTYTFTTMMVGILSMTEGISVLENAILLGVPLPQSFLNLIQKKDRYKAKECRSK
jgi:toxin secretion/phage lysis holin